MFLWEKVSLFEEKKKISKIIINWSKSSDKFLNVISIPYNSTEIFVGVVEKYILQNKKILYITDENRDRINIVSNINKYTNFKNYMYIHNMNKNKNSNLKICNSNTAYLLNEDFDLVIYDDISNFSFHSKFEILNILNRLSNLSNKIIVYSIEEVIPNCKCIVFPVKGNRVPMIEPRTILTRLDINKCIPFVVYDYLKWSITTGRKIMIFVPKEKNIKKISSYIKEYLNNLLENKLYLYDKSDEKSISKFLNSGNAVLITDSFESFMPNMKNTDIMVYFADNSKFTYKKFVYLCGSVVRGEKDLKGEVIFLANRETEDMEKAKNITRNFNKEAWNMGLLSV
jgi:late competence protein required for DNA uptake (superfamily II DNA/RNA helicase)